MQYFKLSANKLSQKELNINKSLKSPKFIIVDIKYILRKIF